MTGQSRKVSLLETCLNVAIGYGVALAAQIAIFPLFGIKIPLTHNLLIGAAFTAVSIIRGYWVRRLFNYLHIHGILR